MRTFLAVELSSTARAGLAGVAGELERSVSGVRWVAPHLLHVTVRFLGEVDPDDLASLGGHLGEALAPVSPFDAILDTLGSFPPGKPARVIWAGVGPGREEFQRVAHEIDGALERWGAPPERRPFTAHVTLGRARRRPVPKSTLPTVVPPTRISVNRVTLFESRLSSGGPSYLPLARFALAALA